MRVRPYLSYSQMSLIEKNPRAYIEKYVYGEELPSNKAQRFGKKVAEALAGEEQFGEIDKDTIISLTPNLKLRELTLTTETRTKEPIPLLAKIDGISEDFRELIDHKTGPRGSWSQEKADNWDQLTFYCTVVYLLKGFIPKAKIVHIETDNRDGEYSMTGQVKEYSTTRSPKDILIMIVRIKKAWKKIDETLDNIKL